MSFLDELRAVREQVLKQAIKDMPVPPDGRYVVRFRPPADRNLLTGVVATYRVGGALSAAQETQLLIDCCQEILHRDPDSGDLASIDGGEPLRFDAGDERWGPDVTTARECVAKLYNLDVQPLVVAGIADALVDWLQGVDAEIAVKAQEAGKAPGAAAP